MLQTDLILWRKPRFIDGGNLISNVILSLYPNIFAAILLILSITWNGAGDDMGSCNVNGDGDDCDREKGANHGG